MIKVKIQNVKKVKKDTKFTVYPFNVKNGRIIITGNIKLDLIKEEIKINIEKVELRENGKDRECICLLDTNISKYCLNSKEKLELLKELFFVTVCNYKKLFSDMCNWKLAMFKLIDENYQDKYDTKTYTLLEELLQYSEDDFKDLDKNSRYRLIISIRNSLKVIQEKKESMSKFDVQSLNNLSKLEITAYSNIMTEYLINKKDDGRINIEYGNLWDETIAKYCKLTKYTATILFPNKEIMENAMKYVK